MRYLTSFLLTSTLYVSVAIGFLYAFDFTKSIEKKKELKRVSLNYVQIVKPKSIIKPIVEEEPKKEIEKVKKEPKKKTKPNKVVKKKIVKKIKAKKTIKKVVKKIVKKEPLKVEPKKENSIPIVVKKESKVDYKKDFLKRNLILIKKHIQSCVKYSKRARRMNVQGSVLVEFTLKKDGSIASIKALDGHKLLRKSTIKAIYEASKSFPPVQKDIKIKVPIEYRLI